MSDVHPIGWNVTHRIEPALGDDELAGVVGRHRRNDIGRDICILPVREVSQAVLPA
jgi:hypothetical protein